ncbi:MAG: hypothetical protein L3J74_08100 [Bacteroidales bacterium]|nr:hypothetical protein [Bacteroidales bacterium]
MEKNTFVEIWLNFDFGFRGDFEGLFILLDKYKAIECGSDLAYFKLSYKKDIIKQLRKEIIENVQIERTDRIFLIVKYKNKIKSGFLFGGHKRPAWEGYSMTNSDNNIFDIL